MNIATEIQLELSDESFVEYQKVLRRTTQKDALTLLHGFKTDRKGALALIEALCHEFGLTVPTVTFRKQRGGSYFFKAQRISLTSEPIVEAVVHELAHHYASTAIDGINKRNTDWYHGVDFVRVLDRLAVAALEMI